MAKSATKKKKPSSQRDLFDLPPAARKTGKAAKASARTKTREKSSDSGYSAKDIEVLEGLEPVRRRPGMYIGGTDEKALHHLFAEVIDNCMDEALAGHASWIEVELEANGFVSVTDNGRGIPVDAHVGHSPAPVPFERRTTAKAAFGCRCGQLEAVYGHFGRLTVA